MADRDLTTRTGKAAALSASNHDQNINSLNGTIEEQTGATYTVLYTDANKTIELNNSAMVCSLSTIATIEAADDSNVDSFKVRIRNTNATPATIDSVGDTDLINGSTSITLSTNDAVILQTNAAGDEWAILATQIGYRGAMAIKTADQALSDDTGTEIQWTSVTSENPGTIWDAGNQSRLTAPAGAELVRLTAYLQFEPNATGSRRAWFKKDGSDQSFNGTMISNIDASSRWSEDVITLHSGIIAVTGGTTYFEVFVRQDSGGVLDFYGSSATFGPSWFAMEVIQ